MRNGEAWVSPAVPMEEKENGKEGIKGGKGMSREDGMKSRRREQEGDSPDYCMGHR